MKIFQGIRKGEKERLVRQYYGSAEKFHFVVKGAFGWESLWGTLVSWDVFDHGSLVILKNELLYPKSSYGWDYFPVWLSECGNSGLIAHWKEPEIQKKLMELRIQEENKVLRCMAL